MDVSQEDREEAIKSFQHWMSNSASHRAFLASHESRHEMLISIPGGEALVRKLAPVDDLRLAYEQLIDACTPAGAIKWHKEICEMLLNEAIAIDALKTHAEVYGYMRAIISDRIRHHETIIGLLCAT